MTSKLTVQHDCKKLLLIIKLLLYKKVQVYECASYLQEMYSTDPPHIHA